LMMRARCTSFRFNCNLETLTYAEFLTCVELSFQE
jgi:hypothetical protein